jgi:transcriptional regulator with XRE-family HTH domain
VRKLTSQLICLVFSYNINMIISEKIRELRMERKISQEQLAKIIGVDRSAVSFWENAVNEPKATYIAKLASFFGVTTDYLLGLED